MAWWSETRTTSMEHPTHSARLMRGFLHSAEHLAKSTNATNIYEVGCGEGKLSNYFHGLGYEVRGSDVSADVITEARETYPQIEFEEKSIYELDASEQRRRARRLPARFLNILKSPTRHLMFLPRSLPNTSLSACLVNHSGGS